MGQQQLLLLVLGIVLVGLAVAGGIAAFNENQRKLSMDQTVQTAVEMAARVIAWKQTPRSMAGGAGVNGLGPRETGLDLADLGYTTNGTAICSYAQGTAHTKGDNCVITRDGEFHIARGAQSWSNPNAIGYIHAIARYRSSGAAHAFRVQIIDDGTRLYTNLDDIQNGRDALPFPTP